MRFRPLLLRVARPAAVLAVVLTITALLCLVGMGRVHVSVRVGSIRDQQRVRSLDLLLAPHHVALGVAPPAFTVIEYGSTLAASLLVCVMFFRLLSLPYLHASSFHGTS